MSRFRSRQKWLLTSRKPCLVLPPGTPCPVCLQLLAFLRTEGYKVDSVSLAGSCRGDQLPGLAVTLGCFSRSGWACVSEALPPGTTQTCTRRPHRLVSCRCRAHPQVYQERAEHGSSSQKQGCQAALRILQVGGTTQSWDQAGGQHGTYSRVSGAPSALCQPDPGLGQEWIPRQDLRHLMVSRESLGSQGPERFHAV